MLWCQLLQMVHWDSTQMNKQQLSVTMEDASMAVADDAAQSPPLHTTRGLHRASCLTLLRHGLLSEVLKLHQSQLT
jgi:hypothetical protein